MKSPVSMAIIAAALLSGRLLAADANTAGQSLQLQLELTDGSRIVGSPKLESVPAQTPYARLDIPVKQIRSLRLGEDRSIATIFLNNGDKLTGVINLDTIHMQTSFGPVSIGTEYLREFRVIVPGEALPEHLRKGLVLYFSFDRDEGKRVSDESGKENHGSVHGARFTGAGKAGGAMMFDGADDYIDAGNQPSLQLTSDFTLAAWIWPEGNQEAFAIISKSHGAPAQNWRSVELFLTDEDFLNGYFWSDSTEFIAGFAKGRKIRRMEWTHVVLMHDSSLPQHQMRAFINGAPCALDFGYKTVSSIPVVRNVTEPVRIGCMRPGDHQFKGRIDEVMIFNRVLSEDEVKALYELHK